MTPVLSSSRELVGALRDAAARRPANERLDQVLAALADDYPGRDNGIAVRLQRLAEVAGLTEFDLALLTAAAAPDWDANVGIAYSLLADRKGPRCTMGLALELAGVGTAEPEARQRLSPRAPLIALQLLELRDRGETMLTRELRVPDCVLDSLLGVEALDPVTADLVVAPVPLALKGHDRLAAAVEAGERFCWVHQASSAAGLSMAAAALSAAGVRTLAIDIGNAPADSLGDAMVRALRDAVLSASALVVVGADRLGDPGAGGLGLLERSPVPVVAVSRRLPEPGWLRRLPLVFDVPRTDSAQLLKLWERFLPEDVLGSPTEWAELGALRLRPEEIVRVADLARAAAAAGGPPVSVASVRDAARRGAGGGGAAVVRVRPGEDLAALVLPPDAEAAVREVVLWARHRDAVLGGAGATHAGRRRGLAALFSGSPGTGKSLAASAIAGELGKDLLAVELSSVVDKYIGETEKNLERVFAEAESLDVVLLFDEADALFGSRSEVRDARDRYANQEVAYLLQRMERFEGITVLTSNLRGNLDPAFARRLDFIVHFPDPDQPSRERLWITHVAGLEADPADPFDAAALAAAVDLSGGEIRNAVVAASFAAAEAGERPGQRHLLSGVLRELRKLGRRTPPGLG